MSDTPTRKRMKSSAVPRKLVSERKVARKGVIDAAHSELEKFYTAAFKIYAESFSREAWEQEYGEDPEKYLIKGEEWNAKPLLRDLIRVIKAELDKHRGLLPSFVIDHWFNESVLSSWKDEGGTIKVQVNSKSAHTRLMTIANRALREAKLEIMTDLELLRNSVLKKLAIAVTLYRSEETPDPPNLDSGGSASMAASQLTATPSPPPSEIASGDPVSTGDINRRSGLMSPYHSTAVKTSSAVPPRTFKTAGSNPSNPSRSDIYGASFRSVSPGPKSGVLPPGGSVFFHSERNATVPKQEDDHDNPTSFVTSDNRWIPEYSNYDPPYIAQVWDSIVTRTQEEAQQRTAASTQEEQVHGRR